MNIKTYIQFLVFNTTEAESGIRSSGSNTSATTSVKKASNISQVKAGPGVTKVEGVVYDILV